MGNEQSDQSQHYGMVIDTNLPTILVTRHKKYVRISSDEDTIQKLIHYYNENKSSFGLKVSGDNLQSIYINNIEHVVAKHELKHGNYVSYYDFSDDYVKVKISFCGKWCKLKVKFHISYNKDYIKLCLVDD